MSKVGGIIHFKVFIGDKNPETAIKLYHNYLGGGHALPPFWYGILKIKSFLPFEYFFNNQRAFGFHQSRWGYKTSDDLERVITSYRKHEIPLDSESSLIFLPIESKILFMHLFS